MDNAGYLASLAAAMSRFSGVIETSDLDARVPTCPEWDVAGLVDHVVVVHTWVGQILEHGRDGARYDDSVLERPERTAGAYAAWYRATAEGLRANLTSRDPEASCWNFSGVNQTFGFWPRRQMNEVNVHTFDAATAAATPFSIPPAEAADGIDELLAVFGPRMALRGVTPDLTAPITFAPDDTSRTWTLLPPGEQGYAPIADDETGSVARITGTASEIYLALWNRVAADSIAIEGDAAVVAAYLASRRGP